MFSNDILFRDERDIELQIERKCLALGLDLTNEYAVQQFARNLLQQIDSLRKLASEGDMQSRIKIEIYGLALLMHRTNSETFGSGYLSKFKSLSQDQSAWASIAQAIWKELDVRNALLTKE